MMAAAPSAPHRGFSLLDEPWIMVVDDDATTQTRSLRDVFVHGDRITRLAGDEPSQDLAILRLLIAVVHRAVAADTVDAHTAIERWSTWWRDGLPVNQIVDYLETHRARFDLLHPSAPFMQTAGLRTAHAPDGWETLVPQLWRQPDVRLFTDRGPRATMTLAEAARWVVHAHAADRMGIKPGALGDPRTKAGRVYPLTLGWLGRQTGLWIDGGTLARTVLLNLVLDDPDTTAPHTDQPVWERPAAGAGTDANLPRGRADLLTWQSRRILLHAEQADQSIDSAVLCYGDTDLPLDQRHLEAMSVWVPSKRSGGWSPVTGLAAQPPWDRLRGLRPGANVHIPLQQWATLLIDREAVSPSTPIHLCWTYSTWGFMASSIVDVAAHRDPVSLQVLTGAGPPAERIAAAADLTHYGIYLLGELAADLRQAAGAHTRNSGGSGEAAAADLERPWHTWCSGTDTVTTWSDLLADVLHQHAADLLAGASSTAWRGRPTQDGQHLNATTAEARFRRTFAHAVQVAHGQIPKEKAARRRRRSPRTGNR